MMNKHYNVSVRWACCFGFATLAATSVWADVIAVDSDVPAIMADPNGSETNPSQYILGETTAFEQTFSESVFVGQNASWNQLLIRNGSGLFTGAYESIFIGEGYGVNNEIVVTGTGSRLGVATNDLHLGGQSSRSRLIVEEGGSVHVRYINAGANPLSGPSNDNLISVSGHGSSLVVEQGLNIGTGSNNNRMDITDGGAASAFMVTVGGGYDVGGGNVVEVSGPGSRLDVSYSIAIGEAGLNNKLVVEAGGAVKTAGLTIGHLQPQTESSRSGEATVSGRDSLLEVDGGIFFGRQGENFLTVKDGGLIRLYNSAGFDPVIVFDAGEDSEANYLRVGSDGYFAWEGDNEAQVSQMLIDGRVLAWNPLTGSWENALTSIYFSYEYYDSDIEAFAATGYDGLGGYTILTSAVPEPGTYAALFALAVAGYALVRRRRSMPCD